MENGKVPVAYYTAPNDKGHRTFLYVSIPVQIANKLFKPLVRSGGKEVHLTINSTFDQYVDKRKCVPQMSKIFNSLRELKTNAERVGILL